MLEQIMNAHNILNFEFVLTSQTELLLELKRMKILCQLNLCVKKIKFLKTFVQYKQKKTSKHNKRVSKVLHFFICDFGVLDRVFGIGDQMIARDI